MESEKLQRRLCQVRTYKNILNHLDASWRLRVYVCLGALRACKPVRRVGVSLGHYAKPWAATR